MEHKLFSELIVKLNVRPDFTLAKMVDDIDMPFRNIKAVKRDINNTFMTAFSDFMSEYRDYSGDFKNYEIEAGSSMATLIEFGDMHELTFKKIKKNCPNLLSPKTVEFDDRVLTEDFIDELDRVHILMSIAMGASFRKAISHIEMEMGIETLQPKIIYDQIFEFWTKFYKNDFCYLSKMEIDSTMTIEESEIEMCLVKFFFNGYLKSFVELEKYSPEQLKVVEGIINDTLNYKWYVIFGFWLIRKLEEKQINVLDMIFSDYKKVHEILDESINHS